jgi:hypothetical protein
MIKRILHIIIALFLLITTMGFTVSKHYCGGDLIKVTINAEAESCCDMEDGCCRNETKHYQLEEDYVSAMAVYDLPDSSIDILFPILFSLVQIEPGNDILSNIFYPDHPPPPEIQTILSLLQTYLT